MLKKTYILKICKCNDEEEYHNAYLQRGSAVNIFTAGSVSGLCFMGR